MNLTSPIIAMLYNTKERTWHPIVYWYHPLPGPETNDKPIRHRSKMHHTTGFKLRSVAVDHVTTGSLKNIEGALHALEEDIEWDGEGMPLDTAYFVEEAGKVKRVL